MLIQRKVHLFYPVSHDREERWCMSLFVAFFYGYRLPGMEYEGARPDREQVGWSLLGRPYGSMMA
jgi:hypothetical protein